MFVGYHGNRPPKLGRRDGKHGSQYRNRLEDFHDLVISIHCRLSAIAPLIGGLVSDHAPSITVTPIRMPSRVNCTPASVSALLTLATDVSLTGSPNSKRASVARPTEAAEANSESDHCSAARAILDWMGLI